MSPLQLGPNTFAGTTVRAFYARNPATSPRINPHQGTMEEFVMGRYLLLWLLGVPIPILVLIYAFGGLH